MIAFGTTASANLPFVDTNSYQDSIAGGLDTYMTKVDKDGLMLWSTYYGGPEDDVAEAISVYGNTAIYVVGHTYSDTILVPTGHVTASNAYNSDQEGFFTKFRQSVSTTPGGVCNGPTNGSIYVCLGQELLLSVVGGELGTDADWVWYEGSCGNSPSIGQGDSLIVTPMANTTYFVRAESITNASDCAFINVIVVIGSPIQIISDSILCEGADYTLEADGNGTIDWSGPNGFTSNLFQNQFTNVMDTLDGWYFMQAMDSIGCMYEDSIELDVVTSPLAALSAIDASCFGLMDGSVSANGIGLANLDFTWEQMFNPYDTLIGTDSLMNIGAGDYMLTLIDSNNCTFVDSITVYEPDSMLIGFTMIPTACSSETGSITLDLDTAQFDISIDWTGTGESGMTIDSLAYGNHEVVLTNDQGCQETYSIFVDNVNQLSLDFNNILDVSCPNDASGSANAVPINGVGPFTFNWVETGETTSTVFNLTAGSYEVIVYDSQGCYASDTITIGSAYTLDYTVSVGLSLCSAPTGFIQVDVSPSSSAEILWNTMETTFLIDSLQPGVYTAVITDTNGCTYPVEEEIEVFNDLDVWTVPGNNSLIEIATTESIETFTNATYGTYSYEWSPPGDLSCTDCPNPEITPMSAETYVVIVTDSSGCIDSAAIDIEIFIPCLDVFIPTMFSPNGDNLNDVWTVIGTCIESCEVKVYNQWGQQIFYSADQTIGWDGMYQGRIVQNDQYVYQVDILYENGNAESFAGYVSVVN